MAKSQGANQKPVRLDAGQVSGLGSNRYKLIKSAAERISKAVEAGYPLEAVALIESVLADRLEKRAQYLHRSSRNPSSALVEVKDGFANLGPLISALKKEEPDPELRAALDRVNEWRKGRNLIMHQMAKIGTGALESWDDRLKSARQIAQDGIEVLCAYDKAERRVCHEGRKRAGSSATCPDALVPIGQEPCSHCLPARRLSRRAEAREART